MATIVEAERPSETADARRFERELATLIGIVEPDRAVTSAAPRGWIGRLVHSRSGAVGLGIAAVAATGGTVAVSLRSTPVRVAQSRAPSVSPSAPTIDQLIPPIAQPVYVTPPAPVVVSQASEETAIAPVRAPRPRSDRPHPAIRVATVRIAFAVPIADRIPAAAYPTMIAATNRKDRAGDDGPAIGRPDDGGGGADDMAGTLVATAPSAPPPPAPRRERRDTVDALRQLRHQW